MNEEKKYSLIEKYLVIYGTPIICVIGTLFHFLFEAVNKNLIFSVIAPVNESVWEHLKIVYFPMLIYWLILYFILRKKINIDFNNWIKALLVATLVGMITVITLFYTYSGIIGDNSAVVDILIYIIAVAFGQILAFNIYKISSNSNTWFFISLFVLAFIFVMFAVFTYYQPKIPLFFDKSSKVYGINY